MIPIRVSSVYDMYLISQQVIVGDLGQQNEIYETWRIVKQLGENQTNTIIRPEGHEWRTLVTEEVVPHIGMYYSEWWDYTNANGLNYQVALGLQSPPSDWQQKARCRGHDFRTLTDGVIEVSIRFSTYWQCNPKDAYDDAVTSDSFQLPTIVEANYGGRVMDLYRKTWTTEPSATLDQSATDIGGTPAQVGSKQPDAYFVPQVKLRIRCVYDVTQVGLGDTQPSSRDILIKKTSEKVGSRNSAKFMAFDEQTMTFDSFAINTLEGEFIEVIYDFTFDKFFEHDQVPQFATDGKPLTSNNGTQLSDVRWQRINRPTEDFNQIFFYTKNDMWVNINDIRKELAEDGYWKF